MSAQHMLLSPESRVAPLPKPPHADQSGFAGRILAGLRRHGRLAAGLACAAGLALAYTAYSWNSDTSGSPILVTEARGDVENVVTAIGDLQPLNTVDVGAQLTHCIA